MKTIDFASAIGKWKLMWIKKFISKQILKEEMKDVSSIIRKCE